MVAKLFFLVVWVAVTKSASSDSAAPSLYTCIDWECEEWISKGKTLLRYIGKTDKHLSFSKNQDIQIISKPVDKGLPDWVGKVGAKVGLVPKDMVREDKINKTPTKFKLDIQEVLQIIGLADASEGQEEQDDEAEEEGEDGEEEQSSNEVDGIEIEDIELDGVADDNTEAENETEKKVEPPQQVPSEEAAIPATDTVTLPDTPTESTSTPVVEEVASTVTTAVPEESGQNEETESEQTTEVPVVEPTVIPTTDTVVEEDPQSIVPPTTESIAELPEYNYSSEAEEAAAAYANYQSHQLFEPLKEVSQQGTFSSSAVTEAESNVNLQPSTDTILQGSTTILEDYYLKETPKTAAADQKQEPAPSVTLAEDQVTPRIPETVLLNTIASIIHNQMVSASPGQQEEIVATKVENAESIVSSTAEEEETQFTITPPVEEKTSEPQLESVIANGADVANVTSDNGDSTALDDSETVSPVKVEAVQPHKLSVEVGAENVTSTETEEGTTVSSEETPVQLENDTVTDEGSEADIPVVAPVNSAVQGETEEKVEEGVDAITTTTEIPSAAEEPQTDEQDNAAINQKEEESEAKLTEEVDEVGKEFTVDAATNTEQDGDVDPVVADVNEVEKTETVDVTSETVDIAPEHRSSSDGDSVDNDNAAGESVDDSKSESEPPTTSSTNTTEVELETQQQVEEQEVTSTPATPETVDQEQVPQQQVNLTAPEETLPVVSEDVEQENTEPATDSSPDIVVEGQDKLDQQQNEEEPTVEVVSLVPNTTVSGGEDVAPNEQPPLPEVVEEVEEEKAETTTPVETDKADTAEVPDTPPETISSDSESETPTTEVPPLIPEVDVNTAESPQLLDIFSVTPPPPPQVSPPVSPETETTVEQEEGTVVESQPEVISPPDNISTVETSEEMGASTELPPIPPTEDPAETSNLETDQQPQEQPQQSTDEASDHDHDHEHVHHHPRHRRFAKGSWNESSSTSSIILVIKHLSSTLLSFLPEPLQDTILDVDDALVFTGIIALTLVSICVPYFFIEGYMSVRPLKKRVVELNKSLWKVSAAYETQQEEFEIFKRKAIAHDEFRQKAEQCENDVIILKTLEQKHREQIQSLKTQLKTQLKESRDIKALIEKALHDKKVVEEESKRYKSAAEKATEAYTKVKEELAGFQTHAKSTALQLGVTSRNTEVLTTKITLLEQENEHLKTQLAGESDKRKALTEEIAQVNQSKTEVQKELVDLKKICVQYEGTVDGLNNDIYKLESELVTIKETLGEDSPLVELAEVQAKAEFCEREAESIRTRYEGVCADNENLRGKLQETEVALEETRNDRETLTKKLGVLETYFKEREEELLKTIENLQERASVRDKSKDELIALLDEKKSELEKQNEIVEALKEELEECKVKHRNEIRALEAKGHESWLSLCQAERKAQDARKDSEILRQKLTTLVKQREVDNEFSDDDSDGLSGQLSLGFSSVIPDELVPPPILDLDDDVDDSAPPSYFGLGDLVPPPPLPNDEDDDDEADGEEMDRRRRPPPLGGTTRLSPSISDMTDDEDEDNNNILSPIGRREEEGCTDGSSGSGSGSPPVRGGGWVTLPSHHHRVGSGGLRRIPSSSSRNTSSPVQSGVNL